MNGHIYTQTIQVQRKTDQFENKKRKTNVGLSLLYKTLHYTNSLLLQTSLQNITKANLRLSRLNLYSKILWHQKVGCVPKFGTYQYLTRCEISLK